MKADGLWLRTLRKAWLRSQPSDSVLLGGAALAVGLVTAAGVWAFKQLFTLVHRGAFDGLGAWLAQAPWLGGWTIFLIPALGGLAAGCARRYLIGPERYHGVAGVIEAVALSGGVLRYKRMPFKAVAAAISIGSGASVGPEDPSVQIGSCVGSMFGQWLKLSKPRLRVLAAAGAAGGIAAAFNAPIAGVFFALEIILGELAGGSALGILLLVSVISSVFTQAVIGKHPAFEIPQYELKSVLEVPLYLGLGLLAGPISVVYTRGLYVAQDAFGKLVPQVVLQPVVAGLLVGFTGIWIPEVFGVGYETIEQILGVTVKFHEVLGGADRALGFLAILLVAKLVMTCVSIGGGFPGGLFAPSLFLGATLGAAYGLGCDVLFPGLDLDPEAFALVGMASVLAGTVRAPLTAILLLFEMTNDYRLILPLMFGVAVSRFVAHRIFRESAYSYALSRKGVRLEQGRDVDVLEGLTVGELMSRSFATIKESDSLASVARLFLERRHHGLPVTNSQGELTGILTVGDVDRARAAGKDPMASIGDIVTRDVIVAHPDETMGAALRRMSARDIGRLPVVDRDNPQRILGLLRRTDMVRAYDLALRRRAAMLQDAYKVRLGELSGAAIDSLTVDAGAPATGKKVKEIPWPRDVVLASIQRAGQLVLPHGETIIREGDILLAVVHGDVARDALRHLISAPLE